MTSLVSLPGRWRDAGRSLLGVVAIATASGATTAADVRITDGEAALWSFDFPVKPKNYSGLFIMDGRRLPPMIPHKGVTLSWGGLNPREGVYDFSALTRELDAADAGGYMVIFRLKVSRIGGANEIGHLGQQMNRMIPDWLVEKHRLDDPRLVFTVAMKGPRPKDYAPLWHAGVQEEFRQLLLEFQRHGFLARNSFMAVYLHMFGDDDGENGSVTHVGFPRNLASSTAACGFANPGEAIVTAMKQRIDWWKEAAGPFAYKVTIVSIGKINGVGEPYDPVALRDYAIAAGFGAHHGFIEHYYYGNLLPPEAGQSYAADGRGYVASDWDHPLRDGRFWGDENEETDEYHYAGPDRKWQTKDDVDVPAGPYPLGLGNPRELAYRSNFFRAAQVGMNFLWSAEKPIDYAGNLDGRADHADLLPNWFTLVAGKGPSESPDAICWLREAWVRLLPGADGMRNPKPQPFRNLDRLLSQVDCTSAAGVWHDPDCTPENNALSAGAVLVDMPYVSLKVRDSVSPTLPADDPASDNEWTARRTDLARGSRNLAFQLNPDFKAALADGHDFTIRVHYWHDAAAPFTVRLARNVRAPDTALETLDLGVCHDTGNKSGWKTAVFTVGAAQFFQPGRALGRGIDFAIRATGDRDVIVRFARIVRSCEIDRAPRIVAALPAMTVTAGVDRIVRLPVHAEGPVDAAAAPGLVYRWQKEIEGAWTDVTAGAPFGRRYRGFDAHTLVITDPAPGDAGHYRVTVANRIRGRTHEVTSSRIPLHVSVRP